MQNNDLPGVAQKILLWDNDGTIMGAKDPNDTGESAKVILPGVRGIMSEAMLNFVVSGCKTPESETQDFDPKKVIARFIGLMEQLPINAAAFSPFIGGTACYLIIKKGTDTIVRKAHKEARYKQYIGDFKKPGVGMLAVIKDLAREEFNQSITAQNSVMVGDTWHDKVAAQVFGIPFIEASVIHGLKLDKPAEHRQYVTG